MNTKTNPLIQLPALVWTALMLSSCTNLDAWLAQFKPKIPQEQPAEAQTNAPMNAQPPHCGSSNPEFQCLALKVVAYQDSTGRPVLSEDRSRILVENLNRVWGPCRIGFQLEEYLTAKPSELGLKYDPYWPTEAGLVRSTFSDNGRFLIVAVGKLSSSTIAVTEMPGASPYGTLVEDAYAENPLTVGHELGHYMGLYHFRNLTNLMNPYIGPSTENLTDSQCATARTTNASSWANMLR